jgi:hypothetical protein
MLEEEKKPIQVNDENITQNESEKESKQKRSITDTKDTLVESKEYKKDEEEQRLSSEDPSKIIEENSTSIEIIEAKNKNSKKSENIESLGMEDLSTEDLISAIRSKLNSAPIQSLKPFIDQVKKTFYERSNQAYNKELKKFQALHPESNSDEEGDDRIEFDYLYPFTEEFKEVLKAYKTARDTYYSEQEKNMKLNLKIKLRLIEELKGLLNSEEKIKETFNHFKDIQERWKVAGQVPKSELNNLWNTYHHHVENFFDYLRINNDLRDIEFKRNLIQKTELCEITEALHKEKNLDSAFATLQLLHEKWKEIGPVGKSNREEIWERFHTATKILHKKRNDFFEKRKGEFEINFKQKISMCAEVESINSSEFSHHNALQKTSIYVNKLRDDWKNIGPVSRAQNDLSWTRFITAIKIFNSKKNGFYKELKKSQNESLQVKIELVKQAESLSQSTEWQNTSQILKKLQRDWKNSGIAPRKESDALWNRLKNACNMFFENLKKQNEILDKKFEVNLQTKEVLLKNVTDYKNTGSPKKDLDSIKSFIANWKSIGKVPSKNIKSIESRFRKSIDCLFEQIDIDKTEKKEIQFKSKIDSIVAENDPTKLSDELFKIQLSLKKCKNELSLLENNISFFKHAKEDNPMVVEVRKNIQNQKDKLREFTSQIAYINTL